LIQDVTLTNPPTFHLMLKGKNGSITIQRININTDPTSPNTDGMDIGSTNMLIQNCHITDGDDHIEIGGSSDLAADLMITNCMFGHGHGVSVGGFTQAGISNVTVINCIFTNSDNAIRMKSGSDRGGLIQNMSYYNIGMTNIKYAPIIIYSYYPTPGNPSIAGITPSVAAGTAAGSVTTNMPSWRDITISNVTATAGQPGIIWALADWPATNITLCKLNITSTDSSAGDSAFALYSVRNVQVVDCQIHPAGT
jgi:polygalacturonase